MFIWFHWLTLLCIVKFSQCVYYDSYSGTPITTAELAAKGPIYASQCTNNIKPCDEYEGRRIDGSCNNLEHPTRGASNTPFLRLLPAVYSPGYEPRKTKKGKKMPLARRLRTNLLCEGKLSDLSFTHMLTNFFVFTGSDILVVQDTFNYVVVRPYCCQPPGKADNQCTPNEIPANDPVHRFSGERCLNMTRPISFQLYGCVANTTVPDRVNPATPHFDLSSLYGNNEKVNREKGRLGSGGLLKFEKDEQGRIWPPSFKTPANVCLSNDGVTETRCHNTPEPGLNTLLGINLIGIWLWREHNRIATELAKINPCWDDEKLFYHARDINIAAYLQILFYELFPTLLGRENLLRDGVISSDPGFRDIYNEEVIPQLSLEYPGVLRWLHTIQEGTLKLYKGNGEVVGEVSIADLSLKTGYLPKGKNMEMLTQGAFRQAGAKSDYMIDPEISERALGSRQRVSDIATNDLAKQRYFGFSPYVKYLEFCRNREYKTFDDLRDVIDEERIERLKDMYESLEDIDLLAGVWMENHIEGGNAPITFYCIVVEQLIRTIVSDRHWYERQERPQAFSYAQLKEIRKASAARLLCNNGDYVTHVQPRAFERIGPGNELTSCAELKKISLCKWKDHTCGQPQTREFWQNSEEDQHKPLNQMRG